MKSNFISASVKNELIEMQSFNSAKTVKNVKRINWELYAALLSIGAIIATVFILSATGVINVNSSSF